VLAASTANVAPSVVFKYFKSMTEPEVNFSDLSNKPVETVGKLQRSASKSLRVHRRGGEEDLVLTTASHAAEVTESASATTTLFITLMRESDNARNLATEVLPTAFPWVKFLPTHDVQAFVVELVDTIEAAESLDNPAPVAALIAAWRHTAELYADPDLLASLRADGDDFGPIPQPPTAS